MGVFTNIEVQIEFKTVEDSNKTFDILNNFEKQIKEHIYKDKPFHVNELDFDGDNDYVEIRIHSGREPNARFHVDCLIKLMQINKVGVISFNADIIQPETYLCFNEDDEDLFEEYEINFENN
tara:strand:+ start:458 stop:823 length:366 start_codon:yes stop_codon:yes gene_type:complete